MTSRRLRLWLVIFPLIAIPLLAMAATGCGIFTFPFDAAGAGIANLQDIKLAVTPVDESGRPLDDVTVVVRPWTIEPQFYLFWSGVAPTEGPAQAPRVVSRLFTHESLGKAAIEITFSKPGYQPTTVRYANAGELKRTGGWGAVTPLFCVDVSQHPHQILTLRHEPATPAEPPPPPER